MHPVTYSFTISLDGYVMDANGDFDFAFPGEEEFQAATEEVRGLSAHLLGRNLYEAMLFWEDRDEDDELDFPTREFTEIWRPLPKVVFSSTLTEVRGSARLATGTLAEEIEALKAEPGEGAIAIGGPTLAEEAARLNLIDEYLIRLAPALVGGGTPFFLHEGARRDLELLENRTLDGKAVYLRYAVKR